MTVVTISRKFGSGGDEIASRVCEILGYKQFDKRQIAQAAQEVGLAEQEMIDYSEESHKISSFLDRLLNKPQPVAYTRVWKEDATGARVSEEFRLMEDTAVALVQKAVVSAHRMGNLVIVGRGGQVILKDQPDVLHVRIEAPLEERIQRVKQKLQQTRQDFSADIDVRREAQDIINQRDAASGDYIKRFYQADWNDPLLYHVVLNTGKLGIEQSAQLIAQLIHTLHLAKEVGGESLTV